MANKAEIITRALRRLRVVSHNRAATADQMSEVGTVLDSLYEEFTQDNATPWQLTDVPDECVNALADLLAAEIAPEFSKPSPVSRSRALTRLTDIINPDDWLVQRDSNAVEYF